MAIGWVFLGVCTGTVRGSSRAMGPGGVERYRLARLVPKFNAFGFLSARRCLGVRGSSRRLMGVRQRKQVVEKRLVEDAGGRLRLRRWRGAASDDPAGR